VVRPRLVAQTPMALARFVAKVDVLLLVAKVAVKFGAMPPHAAEVVPFELPVTAPHENPLKVLARARKAPGCKSVTVTWPLDGELAVAVTPTAAKEELQALIALARLVAKPDVLKGFGITNVPLVELGQVWVPSVPPLSALAGDHAKPAVKLVEME
jgi:hypothetical protein